MTGTAAAQSAPSGGEWTRGSTLNVFGGVSVDGSRAATAAGGAVGWEVTPRLAIEGTAAWFDRGPEAEAFSADLTALVSLVPPRTIMPFAKVGVGVHRTWFDIAESPIPDFYQRRIQAGPVGTTVTFTDPAIVVGGGIRVWLTTNVALRPEVDARVVVRGSRAYWLTTAALRLSYYFEERPTTDRFPGPIRSRGSP
jgi:hypothetical protein